MKFDNKSIQFKPNHEITMHGNVQCTKNFVFIRFNGHIKVAAGTLLPRRLLLFFLAQWQKKGFSHQLYSESEFVGEGIALGDAVHLVHAILELFKCFFLLIRECAVQFLTVPGNQFQQFLEPLVATSALLEGGDVAVPEFVKCFQQNLRIQKR